MYSDDHVPNFDWGEIVGPLIFLSTTQIDQTLVQIIFQNLNKLATEQTPSTI